MKRTNSSLSCISLLIKIPLSSMVSFIRRVWRYQRGNIRIRKSKDRQHNAKRKRTNNDLQNIKVKDRVTQTTGARGTDLPPPTPFFSNFLFANLFSIKFLYFFIISSLFSYFNLFVSIFIQSYVNNLHVSTLYRYMY